MKPLRIFIHVEHEHPGYLCEYLDQKKICYEKIHIAQGEPVPQRINDVSGLVFLGAPVSVNDPLPWIIEETALISRAFQARVPVLGICFGGQLICKALGGEVNSIPEMQVGWHPVILSEHAKDLFTSNGLLDSFYAFEWHGDAFSLPNGALSLFSGGCIKNQGFLCKNCLALQFHPEISKSIIFEWLEKYANCLRKSSECTQSKKQMLENIDEHLTDQRIVANAIFNWWLEQVRLYQGETKGNFSGLEKHTKKKY